jgi:hypothetical protein
MAAKKVIVTDHLHPYLADWLTGKGFEVDIPVTNHPSLRRISAFDKNIGHSGTHR